MNDLAQIIEDVVNVRHKRVKRIAASYGQSPAFEHDELLSEAWIYANDPVRRASVDNWLNDTYGEDKYNYTAGAIRLAAKIDKHLTDYMLAQRKQTGAKPVITEDLDPSDGSSMILPRYESRHDEQTMLLREFASTEWSGFHVEIIEEPVLHDGSAWRRRKDGSRVYGFAQKNPFDIIEFARENHVISEFQAEILGHLMTGDGPSDLRVRYDEDRWGCIRKELSVALKKLRNDMQVQALAEVLGYDPFAVKGFRFESEHRHEDPEGTPDDATFAPVPVRPFECTCDRGSEVDIDRPDPADPLAHPVPKSMRRDSGQFAPWVLPLDDIG